MGENSKIKKMTRQRNMSQKIAPKTSLSFCVSRLLLGIEPLLSAICIFNNIPLEKTTNFSLASTCQLETACWLRKGVNNLFFALRVGTPSALDLSILVYVVTDSASSYVHQCYYVQKMWLPWCYPSPPAFTIFLHPLPHGPLSPGGEGVW